MRISLDFNDDIADELDDGEEKQHPDSEQLNNDMGFLGDWYWTTPTCTKLKNFEERASKRCAD